MIDFLSLSASSWSNFSWPIQDESGPSLYEAPTNGRMEEVDSSEEEEQKETPINPTRFGWVQGVMVGGSTTEGAAADYKYLN